MLDFEIKIAETAEEKNKAFRLRFDIFRKELGKACGKKSLSKEVETDAHDAFCDHLIAVDRTSNLVVGTYRLLLSSKRDPQLGFYAEKFFDISKIKDLPSTLLELSRSCVHRDYRERIVINLLWNGIAKYIKDNDVKYLFGSVRLNTEQPQEVNRVMALIKHRHYAPESLRVSPLKDCVFPALNEAFHLEESEYKQVFSALPPLIKGYLRLGVEFCGPPAWNRDFGSVLFFILLDIEKMTRPYKRHFLGI